MQRHSCHVAQIVLVGFVATTQHGNVTLEACQQFTETRHFTAGPELLGGTYEQQYNLITNKEGFLKVCKVFKKSKICYAEKIIKRQAEIINKEIDKKSYIKSMKTQDNLLKTVDNWTDIERDLGGGQGEELKKDKYGRKKFCALHSSAALCVNNFALFKKHKDRLSFGKYKIF